MPQQERRIIGSVQYLGVGKGYFTKRGLKPYAGVWSLWALGVGAAVSGDMAGWSGGLLVGGFGGLLIAMMLISAMYAGLCFSIAEMSSALPYSGGAYGFGRAALGPWGGFLTGLSQTIEFVLLPGIIVVGIGGYLGALFETPDSFAPVWWAMAYVVFVGLNIWSAETAFKVAVVVTGLTLVILLVFFIGAVPNFSWDLAFGIKPEAGAAGRFLPKGVQGIAWALPFALWYYLALEAVPLAAEETHNPRTDLPRALTRGFLTLAVTGFLVLLFGAGIEPGAAAVGASDEPLFLGLQTVLGGGVDTKALVLMVLAGLVASFHLIVFAYGRNIYALSRAGYFPTWLSLTHSTRKTPQRALVAGALLGYLVAVTIYFSEAIFGDILIGGILLNMAVFAALISYILQMISFIRLRERMPRLERPYRSPLGLPGAWIALVVAAVTLAFLFFNTDFRAGILGCAACYLLAVLYFAVHGRKNLVRSPEERFALASLPKDKNRPPHPETETAI